MRSRPAVVLGIICLLPCVVWGDTFVNPTWHAWFYQTSNIACSGTTTETSNLVIQAKKHGESGILQSENANVNAGNWNGTLDAPPWPDEIDNYRLDLQLVQGSTVRASTEVRSYGTPPGPGE